MNEKRAGRCFPEVSRCQVLEDLAVVVQTLDFACSELGDPQRVLSNGPVLSLLLKGGTLAAVRKDWGWVRRE